MKTFYLFLLLSFFSCTGTKKPVQPIRTAITINSDGSSALTNYYEDSTTIVNLNADGEKISDTTILNLK